MSGLYIKNNLGEENLNLTDAVQKLYKTGIENDIRLFAFARSLFSEIRSPFNFDQDVIPAEIRALKNEPFTTADGTVVNRTKFLTNDYSFSTNNFVWFEKITSASGFRLDRRPSFYEIGLSEDVVAGSSANHIQLGTADSQALSKDINRLIGFNEAETETYIYFILSNITSGGEFQISDSFEGSALTGTALTTAIQNLQASRNPKLRFMRTEGSPIVISENGSIVALEPTSPGSNYDIETFHTNGNFVPGREYTISTLGDMDWNAVGVPVSTTPEVGVKFTATASGDGLSTTTGVAFTNPAASDYVNADTNNTIPIQVSIVGETSGSDNAIIEVYLKADGTFDTTQLPKIIVGGSGYFEDETISIVPQCGVNRYGVSESPVTTKCKNYPTGSNRISHSVFNYNTDADGQIIDNSIEIGFNATFKPTKYYYEVRVGTDDGFFLYNVDDQEFVYLGDLYDNIQNIPSADEPLLILKREDTITDKNLLNISSLDSRSFIFTHEDEESFIFADSLAAGLRSMTLDVSEIRNNFKFIIQNAKRQRLVDDPLNTLETQFNIFEGKNFDGTFRCVLRDPDGVIDRSDVTFDDLSDLTEVDGVELSKSGQKIIAPGIYLDAGGEYKRVFSTDDKPFSSFKGRKILSPKIYELADGETDYSDDSNYSLVNEGDARYSIHTAYYKGSPETAVVGFDMYLSTLIQNISTDNSDGGFVFVNSQSTPNINTGQNVKGFPLFSYTSGGSKQSPQFLYLDA